MTLHLLPAIPARPDHNHQNGPGPQARPEVSEPLRPGDHVVYRRPVRYLAGDANATGIGTIESVDTATNTYTVVDVRTRAGYLLPRAFLRLIPADEIMRDIDDHLAARGHQR